MREALDWKVVAVAACSVLAAVALGLGGWALACTQNHAGEIAVISATAKADADALAGHEKRQDAQEAELKKALGDLSEKLGSVQRDLAEIKGRLPDKK